LWEWEDSPPQTCQERDDQPFGGHYWIICANTEVHNLDGWRQALRDDPLPWLLEPSDPAVRHLTLRLILDRDESDPDVREAQRSAMRNGPISVILDHQDPEGYWVKPGPGYAPKYTGTVWSLMFLDQLGADGSDPRIQKAGDYVLAHTQADIGGFGASGQETGRPTPSTVYHCLNGNLLRALIGFGWIDDSRVERSIEWQARSITGEDFTAYARSATAGPGFACGINGQLPCAWGATKALRGLARVPAARRLPHVQRAIDQGVEFLLSRDPSIADYPTQSKISSNWFKLGFPSGYVADSLQVIEVLTELGYGRDPRLSNAIDWIISLQDARGRWKNRNAYRGRLWLNMEIPNASSKWVTLRACYVLKHALS
jgi:hypothetical protein